MSESNEFQIRVMRRQELPLAVDLAAAEGWNPGMNDAECFFAADANGFLIGELAGKAVGCISAVSYAGRFGFLGLYIVQPAYRGCGFGIQLWQAAMGRLRGHNIGLDGVLAQQSNYAKSGFRLAYRNVRYRGQAQPADHPASVVPAADVGFAAVREYDRRIFPEPRDNFLRTWLAQPAAGGFAAVSNGRLTGYTVVRKCRDGWKIGPLAADDACVARQLYDAASAHAGFGDAVFLDVPEINSAAQKLVRELGLAPVFETARMYTGPNPHVDTSKQFGVTTLELG
jgi:ribosomal protein S18 acetylase RimI-like enzyme